MQDKPLPSGRFVLRIDPEVHARLRAAAAEADLSLNEYCARKLAAPDEVTMSGSSEIVRRAAEHFGRSLVGVAVFGSWARGEEKPSSDVDLLIVLDRNQAIDRRLYRWWDERPVTWQGHAVEPHFVHLPDPDLLPSGLWAEIAVDGIVLFEPHMILSRNLVRIRELIAEGRLVRRRVHGQVYWVRTTKKNQSEAA